MEPPVVNFVSRHAEQAQKSTAKWRAPALLALLTLTGCRDPIGLLQLDNLAAVENGAGKGADLVIYGDNQQSVAGYTYDSEGCPESASNFPKGTPHRVKDVEGILFARAIWGERPSVLLPFEPDSMPPDKRTRIYFQVLASGCAADGRGEVAGRVIGGQADITLVDGFSPLPDPIVVILETPDCADQQIGGDETDVDCGGTCGAKCESGQGCLIDSDCQSGACGDSQICLRGDGEPCTDDGECANWCLPTSADSTDGLCAEPSDTNEVCANDNHCEEGHQCTGSQCLLLDGGACSGNTQCASTCIKGSCSPLAGMGSICDASDDCSEGHTCDDEKCVLLNGEVCTDNASCLHTCVEGQCAERSSSLGSCDMDDSSDCASNHTCIAQICLRDLGQPCDTNQQCANQCIGGVCTTANATGGGCDPGDDTDCSEDGQTLLCVTNPNDPNLADCRRINASSCDSNSQCQESCVGGVCVALRETGGGCDANDNDDCQEDHVCRPVELKNYCLLVNGQTCSENADCEFTCVNGTCATPGGTLDACDQSDDNDCTATHRCEERVCLLNNGESCDANSQCAEICVESSGLCAPRQEAGETCDDSEDCQENLICKAGLCIQPIYVDASQTGGTSDGQSWSTAYDSLAAALADLGTPAEPTEVWIASGIHLPGPLQSDSFILTNNVILRGGMPVGAVDIDQQDPNQHRTILSGDIDGDGVLNASNSMHVVQSTSATASSRIDGIVIAFGYSDGVDETDFILGDPKVGGGILLDGASPTLHRVMLVNNYATNKGAGLYSQNGDPMLSRTKVTANKGFGLGFEGGSPKIFNSWVVGNEGGLESIGSEVVAFGTVFAGNDLPNGEEGQAILRSGSGNFSLINSTIIDHSTNAAVHLSGGDNTTVRNTLFWNNDAPIVNDGHTPSITYSAFAAAYTDSNLCTTSCGLVTLGSDMPFELFLTTSAHRATLDNFSAGALTSTLSASQSPNWDVDEWAGKLLRLKSDATRTWMVVGNTQDTVSVWGDLTGHTTNDDTFLFRDISITTLTPCVEGGSPLGLNVNDAADLDEDGDTAEDVPLDILEQSRILDGDNDGNDIVDIGATENR